MSALLVTAGRTGQRQDSRDLRLEPVTAHAYRAFLASRTGEALGPGFLQCPSWAQVKDGWRPLLLGWGPAPAAGG